QWLHRKNSTQNQLKRLVKKPRSWKKKDGRQPMSLSLLKSTLTAAISSSKNKMSWVIQNY
ncbi:MAG: hypothetical protein MR656_01565, partial [Bacteroidales bacterium]|nr:hypothetical protein [Bacteroidales bacterium]